MSTDQESTDKQELDSNTDDIEVKPRRAQESGEVFRDDPHSER